MASIVFHAGMPKAGSTTIQDWLAGNLRLLAEQFGRPVARQFGIRPRDVADGHQDDVVPANAPQLLEADDVSPPHAAAAKKRHLQRHPRASPRIA